MGIAQSHKDRVYGIQPTNRRHHHRRCGELGLLQRLASIRHHPPGRTCQRCLVKVMGVLCDRRMPTHLKAKIYYLLFTASGEAKTIDRQLVAHSRAVFRGVDIIVQNQFRYEEN